MAKAKRPSISKSLRFEVFKRDSFRCQYCGAAAPDVVLHVDHIRPVADGGETTILNLITSCQPCNLGKSNRKLNDHTTAQKARNQLEQLQERREQIEMMMMWQSGLADLETQSVEAFAGLFTKLTGYYVRRGGSGTSEMRKILSKFSLAEACEAMRTSVAAYVKMGEDGKPTPESVEMAWKKILGVCRVNKAAIDKPYIKDLYYLRGILRRRLDDHWQVNRDALDLLEQAYLAGATIERLTSIVKTSDYWREFEREIADEIGDGR